MRHVFRVTYSSILYIKKGERHTHPLVKYFQNSTTEDIFINDIVFIEEHEHTEWTENLIRAIPKETFLLLPIYGTKDIIIGAYAIGVKPFGDFYDTFEIAALHDIADFLSRHLRYIEVYAELEDISRNLDRKVDEKTIEYNTLISRQRDFISTLSHEIKTPITSSILHLDNIIDDIEHNTPQKDIQSELVSLSDQLVETGGLLSRLFSIEYIDRQSSILYYEIVDIRKFLETQFELHKKVHSKCTYRSSIDAGI
jgi:signal transduction histidine kinase